jgi:hypothetical protein
MTSFDSKSQHYAEIVELIESQLDTLEKKLSAASQRPIFASMRTGATASVRSTANSSTVNRPHSFLQQGGKK